MGEVQWLTSNRGVDDSKGRGVQEVLSASQGDGVVTSGKVRVKPKNTQKCPFILNCSRLNDSDGRKPMGFRLPQIEHLREAANLDISNCFWSIRRPWDWGGGVFCDYGWSEVY